MPIATRNGKKRAIQKMEMGYLTKAISKLRTIKWKDPHGHINELYKNMGEDGLSST